LELRAANEPDRHGLTHQQRHRHFRRREQLVRLQLVGFWCGHDDRGHLQPLLLELLLDQRAAPHSPDAHCSCSHFHLRAGPGCVVGLLLSGFRWPLPSGSSRFHLAREPVPKVARRWRCWSARSGSCSSTRRRSCWSSRTRNATSSAAASRASASWRWQPFQSSAMASKPKVLAQPACC